MSETEGQELDPAGGETPDNGSTDTPEPEGDGNGDDTDTPSE